MKARFLFAMRSQEALFRFALKASGHNLTRGQAKTDSSGQRIHIIFCCMYVCMYVCMYCDFPNTSHPC